MTHARFAFDEHWKLYGDGRFFDLRADIDEVSVLDEDTLTGKARLAKARLHELMSGMADGPVSEPYQNPPVPQIAMPEPSYCQQ